MNLSQLKKRLDSKKAPANTFKAPQTPSSLVEYSGSEGFLRLNKAVDVDGNILVKTASPTSGVNSVLLVLPRSVYAESPEQQKELADMGINVELLPEEAENSILFTNDILATLIAETLSNSKTASTEIVEEIENRTQAIPPNFIAVNLYGERTVTPWKGSFRYLNEMIAPSSCAMYPDMAEKFLEEDGVTVKQEAYIFEALVNHHSSRVMRYLKENDIKTIATSDGKEIPATSWSHPKGKGILPVLVVIGYVINLTEVIKKGTFPEVPELGIFKIRPFKMDTQIPAHQIMSSYPTALENYAKLKAVSAQEYGMTTEEMLEALNNVDFQLPIGNYWVVNINKKGDSKTNPSKVSYSTAMSVFDTESSSSKKELSNLLDKTFTQITKVANSEEKISPKKVTAEEVAEKLTHFLNYVATNPLAKTLSIPTAEEIIASYNDALVYPDSECADVAPQVDFKILENKNFKFEPKENQVAAKAPSDKSDSLTSSLRKKLDLLLKEHSKNELEAIVNESVEAFQDDSVSTDAIGEVCDFLNREVATISDEVITSAAPFITFLVEPTKS